jgi:mannose-1-phosphate guanylyltransferase
MSTVDAVILVGGQGTRLRPLTLSAPKPMLPTAGVPFVEHQLSRIRAAGITHVILGTSYQASTFAGHFGDGSAFGLDLEYVFETEPLGTGGGIRNVASALRGDTVMIFNGDVLSGVDLGALLTTHRDNTADVTLYLTRVLDPRAFGCVPTDADGRVTAFLEKDPEPVTDQINAGTYVFKREVVEAIPTGRPVSVERETFPQLLAGGARVYGHVDTAYWRDLGTPGDFIAGSADLVRGIAPTDALSGPRGDFRVLEGAQIAPDARLGGGTVIGRNCIVGAGAVINGSVVFDGARIEAGARVSRSAIGRDVVVGELCVVRDAVLGDGCRIGGHNELISEIRIWPNVELPERSVRFTA